jgi:hypothetical protein
MYAVDQPMKTRIDPLILNEIKDKANDNIELVLDSLGIDADSFVGFSNEIRCPCPVHGGNNKTAFSYSTRFKKWRCYTHGCSNDNDSIFGLVMAVLSKTKGEDVNFIEAASWLSKVVAIDLKNSSVVTLEDEEIHNIIKVAKLEKRIKRKDIGRNDTGKCPIIPISSLNGKIEPSWYFLNQGFSKEILTKYNVGYCSDPKKPMYLRSYAPVLSEDGDNIIGVTGRIIYEKCEICGDFHDPDKECPVDNPRVKAHAKWFHYGFSSGSTLYNESFAKKYIAETGIAVITEGPKEVWWLEQHDVHNSLCIFGLNISDFHLKKLIKMNVTNVVVALNNDEAGIEAIEKIDKTLGLYFKIINMHHLLDDGSDIAATSTDKIINKIRPFIKSLEKNEQQV